MRIVALAFLAGCGEPTQTGPYALVGRLVDASGAPVAGQTIESLEGRDVTDALGRFVVEWKAPNQHADFVRDGIWYSRAMLDGDTGTVPDLRLPALGPTWLRCERVAPCDLRLEWDLGDGLSARLPATCPPGETTAVPQAPSGTPIARCAARPDHAEEQAPVAILADGFVLQDAPQPIRVEVHAEPGDEPATCAVWVASRPAEPTGDGAFAAQASGRLVVTGLCDARPATPQVVTVSGPATVILDWSSIGPDLDLGPWLADARLLVVQAERVEEGEGGWRLEVAVGSDGVFHLPPLPRGAYHLSAGMSGAPANAPERAGAVVLAPFVRDEQGKVVGLQGSLVVGTDTTEGALRVIAP